MSKGKFEPMLATSPTATIEQLGDILAAFGPMIVTPKLDGIRCLTIPAPAEVTITRPEVRSQPFSRTLKLIPNAYIRETLADLPGGLDGELMIRRPATIEGAPDTWAPFDEVTSAVMSRDGEPDFRYVVFDTYLSPTAPYEDRLLAVATTIEEVGHPRIECVPFMRANSVFQINAAYQLALDEGLEGLILRSPSGPYKYGRATAREGYMLKLKPKSDAEAEVIQVIPLERNRNEATADAFGRKERSSHKAGKVATELMGALRVQGLTEPFAGHVFNIGTGFTAEHRAEEWPLGTVVRFTYSPDASYELPRHPSFAGRRPKGA